MTKVNEINPNVPIMLYDGVCNFCCSAVQFVFKHDKTRSIRFLAQQSQTAANMLEPFGLSNKELKSLILIYNNKAYTFSDAAIKIAIIMGGFWSVAYIAYICPKFIRDFLYRMFAANRYRLFGFKQYCTIPKPEFFTRIIY